MASVDALRLVLADRDHTECLTKFFSEREFCPTYHSDPAGTHFGLVLTAIPRPMYRISSQLFSLSEEFSVAWKCCSRFIDRWHDHVSNGLTSAVLQFHRQVAQPCFQGVDECSVVQDQPCFQGIDERSTHCGTYFDRVFSLVSSLAEKSDFSVKLDGSRVAAKSSSHCANFLPDGSGLHVGQVYVQKLHGCERRDHNSRFVANQPNQPTN